jgi:hypothetical protein
LANIPNLSDDEWLKLLKRLTLHADRKLVRLAWRGITSTRGGKPPGGVEAGDLAAGAITDLIEGTRAWDQEANPDLLKHLRSVVDSKISHLVEGLENRRTRRLGPPDPNEESSTAYQLASRDPSPVELVADREAADRLRAAIHAELRDDESAYQIMECLEAGMERAEIIEYLGIPAMDFDNAKKRLCRKVEKAQNNVKKGRPHG